MIYNWIKKHREADATALHAKKRSHDLSKQSDLERENSQLKTLLGEKELEIAILRDLVKKTKRP